MAPPDLDQGKGMAINNRMRSFCVNFEGSEVSARYFGTDLKAFRIHPPIMSSSLRRSQGFRLSYKSSLIACQVAIGCVVSSVANPARGVSRT